jgi:hypothetical protein
MVYFLDVFRKLSSMEARHVRLVRRLALGSLLSIIASGVHHFDNFYRVEDYYLVPWIYNGHFFILDIGIVNWVCASFFASLGVHQIVNNYLSNHPSVEVTKIGLRYLYIHCVMIWSGQLHYSIESITVFKTNANISILAEGLFAIACHVYCFHFWLHVSDGSDRPPDKSPYTTLPQEDVGGVELSKDLGNTSLRRRSKDYL